MWPKKRRKRTKDFSDSRAESVEGSDAVGDALSDEAPAETETEIITEPMVRERALRLLANREHGRKELQQKLLQRDMPAELVTSVLDKLAEEGLQCDSRFAESYTRMRISRCYGANKVRADLQTRGIEQSVIEEAVKSPDVNWGSTALAALEKKYSVAEGMDQTQLAKMQRHLYQRGFDITDIKSAIKEFTLTKA